MKKKVKKKVKTNSLTLSDLPGKKSVFINSDGKFINLCQNNVLLAGYGKEATHQDLYNYLRYRGIKEENLIRANDGTYLYITEEAYIDLPEKELNSKQYEAILKWLDMLSLTSNKKYVRIGFEKYEFFSKSNPNGLLPEDLIKAIKKNYATSKEN